MCDEIVEIIIKVKKLNTMPSLLAIKKMVWLYASLSKEWYLMLIVIHIVVSYFLHRKLGNRYLFDIPSTYYTYLYILVWRLCIFKMIFHLKKNIDKVVTVQSR